MNAHTPPEGPALDAGTAERWIEAGRRQRRRRAAVFAVVCLAGAGFWFGARSKERRAEAAALWLMEQQLAQSDAASLAGVLDATARSDDPSPTRLALAARAEMLRYLLHTRRASEARHSVSLLAALPEDSADPAVHVALATGAALFGAEPGTTTPTRPPALDPSHPWTAAWDLVDVLRARREGREPGTTCTTAPSCAVLALDAFRTGDWSNASRHAEVLLTRAPDHEVAEVVHRLVSLRSAPAQEAAAALADEMSSGKRGGAGTALVAVEAAARLAEVEGHARAREVAEAALATNPSAPWVAIDVSRRQRLAGQFSAARHSAEGAAKDHPWDGELLLAWADPASTLDDPAILRRRAADAEPRVGPAAHRRVLSLAMALEGEPAAIDALPGLEAPSDTILLRVRLGGETKDADLQAAVADRARRFGSGSVEHAEARLVHLGARSTDIRAGTRTLTEITGKLPKSPYLSWILGKAEARLGKSKPARDHLLDACFRGQDFALGCLDLAALYDVQDIDAVGRATQGQARDRYLRLSPKGHHADAVRSALGSSN